MIRIVIETLIGTAIETLVGTVIETVFGKVIGVVIRAVIGTVLETLDRTIDTLFGYQKYEERQRNHFSHRFNFVHVA